jgi:hypothetical protein
MIAPAAGWCNAG